MAQTASVGCVIMASGLSRRFGSNKLLAEFAGQPMLCRAFAATVPLQGARVVVTRSAEVQALCEQYRVPVLLHALPGRNDTVRLGLSHLLARQPGLQGCMFLPGDQPLLTAHSVRALLCAFDGTKKRDICRLSYAGADGSAPITGSPVLFGRRYFEQLLCLPEGKGGSVLLKRYPDCIQNVSAVSPLELADADTPQMLAQLEKAFRAQKSE